MEEKIEERSISGIINSVSLALDGYDDIFSDFDHSHYNKRVISDDFTREIQKRYAENRKGEFEVIFSLPEVQRSAHIETTIKKRLIDHYKNKVKNVDYKIKKLTNTGITRIGLGLAIFSIELFLRVNEYNSGILFEVGNILLIPAAWFTIWTGYEHLVDHPAELYEQREFYKKFENANYQFVSEETITEHISKAAGEMQKPEEKK